MWEALTNTITPYLLDALALRPGERVLDVGCGAATATLELAAAVGPTGTVTGVDISHAVIAEAQRRAGGGTRDSRISLLVGDAAKQSFPGGPFTVATSQFGVMFFDDPVAAFSNIRRQLTPEGRLCFACWHHADRNPWSYAGKIADLLPPVDVVGKNPPGPFALSEPRYVARVLTQAGYREVTVSAHNSSIVVPHAMVVDDDELAVMGVPNARLRAARSRVEALLTPYRAAPGWLQIPIAFLIVQARVSPGG